MEASLKAGSVGTSLEIRTTRKLGQCEPSWYLGPEVAGLALRRAGSVGSQESSGVVGAGLVLVQVWCWMESVVKWNAHFTLFPSWRRCISPCLSLGSG